MIKYSKHERQKEHMHILMLKNRNCTVSDVSRENGIADRNFVTIIFTGRDM